MNKLLIGLFLMWGYVVSAQSAQELIHNVQAKFNTIENFSAGIAQTKLDGKHYAGKFYYAKGNKYRIEFKNMLIVSDGNSIWNFNKKINRVVITNLSDNPDAFSFEKFIFDFPGKCKMEITGKSHNNYEVKFIPLDDDLGFDWAKVTITPDSLIKKIQIADYSGNKFNVDLTNIKINQNIPKNKFTFEPKKGVKIVDLR